MYFNKSRLLRARRALTQFKDVPLRTMRALMQYNGTDTRGTVITPFWLSADEQPDQCQLDNNSNALLLLFFFFFRNESCNLLGIVSGFQL